MHRTRRLACLLALILALPSAAFAQGAGDDQYQDPFAEEPTAQQDPGDGGIGDEPPTGGGNGDDGQGQGDGGTGGETEEPTAAPAPREDPNALPRTGTDPRPLVLIGAAFLLAGLGLRLRTIDPDAF